MDAITAQPKTPSSSMSGSGFFIMFVVVLGIAAYVLVPKRRRNPRRFTARDARRVGRRLGVRFGKITSRNLARGMNVELEHGSRDRRTDVTHDDPTKTAKIALAHLYERPDYYQRLAWVERGSK